MQINTIKMMVESNSHLDRLVNNQIMDAMPIKGMNHPPGTLNVFSGTSSFLLRNTIIATITARYINRMALLARIASCLNPPETEKIKIREAYVMTAR